jgi:putative endonuclease
MRWFSQTSKRRVEAPQSLGKQGELWAQTVYRKRGYTVIAENEYNRTGKRLGEIDFICRDSRTLIFVEVKTRTTAAGKFGTAAEAVDALKQRRMLRAIKLYLLKHSELVNLRPQIDVCVIEVANVDKSLYSANIIMNSVEDWN